MNVLVASNDRLISVGDAQALLREIERLRAEIARLEGQIATLDRLAYRDPLLDLPNRRSFMASLERLISRVDRYDESAALMYVDLDGLKAINDRFGHKAGDAALVQVARTLVSAVRASDIVARLGGDEFGILLERVDELTGWNMALRVVETVVASRLCVDGTSLPLSVAVGVAALLPGDSCDDVMNRADHSMYAIKMA
jgi:diguanylate cyclase (GGDEF)-like protein